MKRVLLFVILLITATSLYAQSSNIKDIRIATWKNNTKGAYSIFHDDFCMETSRGIEAYADTIAYKRDIPIAFAIVTGECSKKEWREAKRLISHGHEITNHSNDHYCGLPVEWCPRNTYTRKDYKVQFDLSQELIEKNTGKKANLYVFPYDLFDDTMVSYLKDSVQIGGSRSGIQDKLNHPDSIQPFGIRFHILRPEHSTDSLNGLAQQAIFDGGWAVRGAHGIEEEGEAWGSIPLQAYRNHMDFLQAKKKTNELWVDTPTAILNYSLARYATSISYSAVGGTDKIRIKMNRKENTPSTSMTLLVDLKKARLKKYRIKQGDTYLAHRIQENQLIFDCRSDGGDIFLE